MEKEKCYSRFEPEIRGEKRSDRSSAKGNNRTDCSTGRSGEVHFYVILPWDNLWDIARRYYRDGRKMAFDYGSQQGCY